MDCVVPRKSITFILKYALPAQSVTVLKETARINRHLDYAHRSMLIIKTDTYTQ